MTPKMLQNGRFKKKQQKSFIESVLVFMTHRIALVDFGVYNFVNYSVLECLESMVPLKPRILKLTVP